MKRKSKHSTHKPPRHPAPEKAEPLPVRFPESDFAFSIHRTSDVTRSDGRYHLHSEPEFHYIYRGTGYYFIGRRLYKLNKNCLIIIHGNDPHAFYRAGEESFRHSTSIHFDSSLVTPQNPTEKEAFRSVLECRPGFPHRIVLSDRESSELELTISAMEHEYGSDHELRREVTRHFLAAFLLRVSLLIGERQADRHDDNEHSPLVQEMLDYVDIHFREPISLEDIARSVNRSTFHVSHIFNAEVRIGFREYITARRVLEARRLIESGDSRKALAIAMDSGFTSLSSFSRSFRQATGMTPTQYRKHCANT